MSASVIVRRRKMNNALEQGRRASPQGDLIARAAQQGENPASDEGRCRNHAGAASRGARGVDHAALDRAADGPGGWIETPHRPSGTTQAAFEGLEARRIERARVVPQI